MINLHNVKKFGLALVALLGLTTVLGVPAYAASYDQGWDQICNSNATATQKEAAGCNEAADAEGSATDRISTVINVALGVIAVIAVIVIIIAGILMATANGDAGKVAKARNAILYSVIGLLVCLLAFAIVNFIIGVFL